MASSVSRHGKIVLTAAKLFVGSHSDQVTSWTSESTNGPTSWVIHPASKFLTVWNSIQMCILLFICITLPVRFADFLNGQWLSVADNVIDIYFILDLLMNFFVGYIQDDGEYINDCRKTAFRYVSGRFAFDLLTSVPGSFFSDLGNASFIPTFFKLLRLSRMLKLIRILQMNLLADSSLNPGIIALIKLVLQIVFAAHIGGTFFWVIKKDDPNLPDYLVKNNLDDASPLDLYVAALYYAVTTLSTVGYGDIVPTRTSERGYTLGLMLVGTILFGTVLNSIAEVVTSIDPIGYIKRKKLESVKDLMRRMKANKLLTIKVKEFYEQKFRQSWMSSDIKIMEELPANLRLELGLCMCIGILRRHVLFRDISVAAQNAIFQKLKPLKYKAGSRIYQEGEEGNSMFIIIFGTVEVSSNQDFLMELNAGAVFGETTIASPRIRMATIEAKDMTHLFTLHGSDVVEALESDAQMRAQFRVNAAKVKESYQQFLPLSSMDSSQSRPQWSTLQSVFQNSNNSNNNNDNSNNNNMINVNNNHDNDISTATGATLAYSPSLSASFSRNKIVPTNANLDVMAAAAPEVNVISLSTALRRSNDNNNNNNNEMEMEDFQHGGEDDDKVTTAKPMIASTFRRDMIAASSAAMSDTESRILLAKCKEAIRTLTDVINGLERTMDTRQR